MIYADIILPLFTGTLYTYQVPEKMVNLAVPGMRAIVPLGDNKYYTGIIKRIHQKPIENQEYKLIYSFPDEKPAVNKFQLDFWDWIADYYMCSHGEVYRAAIPAELKIESKLYILHNQNFTNNSTGNKKLDALLNIIRDHPAISVNKLTRIAGKKNLMTDLYSLENIGAIKIEKKFDEEKKISKEKYIIINPPYNNEAGIHDLPDKFERAAQQKNLILKFFELAGENISDFKIRKKDLSQISTYGTINSLIKKGVFREVEIEDKLSGNNILQKLPFQLNSEQTECLKKIKEIFQHKNVCLLHGVTSSGKTEIYIHLINEIIQKGKQVLYLLPEIALTSQIVERLQMVFGNKVEVYHSRFSQSERTEIYKKLLEENDQSEGKVILGVRSSIFLPFNRLGLVIIDEEHENSYKQFDPAPRYHARDAGIILALLHKARVLLGTATPSVESWINCKDGKFGIVSLKSRYGDIKPPDIIIANIRAYQSKNKMKSVFTPMLLQEINNTVSRGKQIILFQNRRGYASYLECSSCGWIPRCKSCDVSLTYHKYNNSLVCHYCGLTRKIPPECDECNNEKLLARGFGTELIEDDIELIIPGAKVARLDLDTSRTIRSYQKILNDFSSGKTNILVGTQMISKGLDFDNVELVGVINADQMLNYPDFRAHERSFQLMMQVSGRAGRRNKQGKVIIQTSDPANPIIKFVRDNNYTGFYQSQFTERQLFHYPPFVRMIRIILKHRSSAEVNKAAMVLADNMRAVFGRRVLGAHDPVINRLHSLYLKNIILKIEKKSSFQKARYLLGTIINDFRASYPSSLLKINVDVDPL